MLYYCPQVVFNICQVKRNKELVAVEIMHANVNGEKQMNGGAKKQTSNGSNGGQFSPGFVAALKDGFGFIETVNHDQEIFFHFR